MSGIPRDDFESLARRYWAAWGDALRSAVPGAGGMPGMGGPRHAPPLGVEAWQESLDWWTRLAHGGRSEANDALGHFNRQAKQWHARMQEVAARFAGQEASAADIARAWKEALGASGENPFPEMLRSMRGHHLQGLEQWVEDASPWLQSVRDEGLSGLRMPAFGAGREHQERLQQLGVHMAEYQQASSAYAALMARAQQDAFAIFEDRLIDHEEPGRQLQSARALFDLWIDAAEEAYAEIALSPEFREVYGRLVNAQMRVRGGVQRMVEDACAQLGMPTRSELDGAHRKQAQLEREVRRLRDALGRLEGQAPASRASAAPRRPARAAASGATAVQAEADAPAAPRRATRSAKVVKDAAGKSSGRPAGKAGEEASDRKPAKKIAKKAAKKAAKKSPTGKATPVRKAAAGKGFGSAISGSIPQAPEPIAAKSSKPAKKAAKKSVKPAKSVKKGKR